MWVISLINQQINYYYHQFQISNVNIYLEKYVVQNVLYSELKISLYIISQKIKSTHPKLVFILFAKSTADSFKAIPGV